MNSPTTNSPFRGLGLVGFGTLLGVLISSRGEGPARPEDPPPPPGRAVTRHTGPTIEKVRSLASLVTSRVDVADVQETRIDGHTGGVTAALLVKGDFLLGVDLSRARFESLDEQARTAVLVLPQPRATSPRLDHARTRLYTVSQTGLWQVVPGEQADAAVLNAAYRDAQQLVADAAARPALALWSRRQAEQVLGSFFDALGWSVTVRWEEP